MVSFFMKELLAKLSENRKIYLYVDEKSVVDLQQWSQTYKIELIALPFPRSITVSIIFTFIRLLISLYIRKSSRDHLICTSPLGIILGSVAGRLLCYSKITLIFQGFLWSSKPSGSYGWFKRKLYFRLDQIACKIAAKTFVISPSAVKLTRRAHLVADAECISLYGSLSGVDNKRYRHSRERRKNARKRLQIPDGSVVIGCICRLHPDKGIELLFSSFKALKYKLDQKNVAVTLVIIGPDEGGIKNIRTQLNRHNSVKLLTKNVASEIYFPAIDIFCMPSQREGFGNVFIEAAFNKIPSIALRRSGVVDAIANGVTGILVDGSETSITQALYTLCVDVDKRDQMGYNAWKFANERFNRADVVAVVSEKIEGVEKWDQ